MILNTVRVATLHYSFCHVSARFKHGPFHKPSLDEKAGWQTLSLYFHNGFSEPSPCILRNRPWLLVSIVELPVTLVLPFLSLDSTIRLSGKPSCCAWTSWATIWNKYILSFDVTSAAPILFPTSSIFCELRSGVLLSSSSNYQHLCSADPPYFGHLYCTYFYPLLYIFPFVNCAILHSTSTFGFNKAPVILELIQFFSSPWLNSLVLANSYLLFFGARSVLYHSLGCTCMYCILLSFNYGCFLSRTNHFSSVQLLRQRSLQWGASGL